MTEHIRRRPAVAIFEQMWRSSEQECSRLEHRCEQLGMLLRSALPHIRDAGDVTLETLIKQALNEV